MLAVEANKDIAALAQAVVDKNEMGVKHGGVVSVTNQLSTQLQLSDATEGLHARKANVLVSEIIGTLLLGESQLDYMEDARARLLTPDAVILPAAGIQYVTLIQSFDYANLTGVASWKGFDLGPFNELKDTDSMLKSKQVRVCCSARCGLERLLCIRALYSRSAMLCCGQVGIRIADLDFKEMADPINLLEVDFYTSTMKDVYPKNSFLPR